MKNSCSQSVISIFVFFFKRKESKAKDVNGADIRVSGYFLPVIRIKVSHIAPVHYILVLAPRKPCNPAYGNLKAFLVLLLEEQVMKGDWTYSIITV